MRMTLPRWIAALALLVSLPVLLLKLPWLPGTILSLKQALSESAYTGSEAYLADRAHRIDRAVLALVLYASGGVAIVGLIKLVRRRVTTLLGRIGIWIWVGIIPIGLIAFESPRITSHTDPSYTTIVIELPRLVSCLAGLAILWLSVGAMVSRKPGLVASSRNLPD